MIKDLIITPNAQKQISKLLNKDHNNYFRITVKGGGCSGFKYDFTTDNNLDESDVKIKSVIIDRGSLDLIAGSIVDFKEEMIGSSFVIENPKAKSSCGCGLSFSV